LKLAEVLRNKWVVRGLAFVVFLASWQVIGDSVSPIFFAPPTAVAVRFGQLWFDPDYSLPAGTIITLETVLVGYVASVVVGVPLGLAMGRIRLLQFAVDPYVNMLYATPTIVLIPLVSGWFGSSISSSYIIVFIAAVLSIIINTMSGVANVNQDLLETGQSFGLDGAKIWRKIVLPASVPFILAGLRIGIGHAVIGAILAELFLYSAGLGLIMENFAASFDVSAVISALVMTIVLGVGLTEILKLIERRISGWSLTSSGVT
jgi:ABC-type nitrate/sulfonate/bicarbonate transport system permease component